MQQKPKNITSGDYRSRRRPRPRRDGIITLEPCSVAIGTGTSVPHFAATGMGMTASRSGVGVTCMPVLIAGPDFMGTEISGDLTLAMTPTIATGGGIADMTKSGASTAAIGTTTKIASQGAVIGRPAPHARMP